MRRVPIVATIRDAYTFATTHLGGIIGLIWVPMLLLTVMGFFSLQRYYNDFIEAMASGNTAAMAPSLLMMLGYLVAMLLLLSMMYVAVVQLAMGSRSGSVLAHFAFGAQEWRMFRAFFAFVGLFVVLPAFIFGNAAVLMAGVGGAQPMFALGLLGLVYCVILLAMPRFLALLPAVAVAETAPVLRRAWMLSAGNFWRLLAVLVAVFGPVLILFTALEMVLADYAPGVTGGSQQVQLLAGVMRAREVLPLISGLSFLVAPLVVGLFAGASVSAWRALKDEPVTEILA